MELQGQVGDLGRQSRLELQELLLRQEKILSNRGLLQTLPDKGRKIKEFAERIRLAIEQRNEEERRQSLVSDARAEFQSKYKQAFTAQKRAVSTSPAVSHHNQECASSAVSGCTKENSIMHEEGDHSFSTAAAIETMETAATGASPNSDLTKEGDLVEALQRVTLSESGAGLSLKPKELKKPHILAVLEKSEQSSAHKRQRFKPNQLLQGSSISPSGSSSPSQSSESLSPLSAQARKERDRKHLDDITAARLPPLHHSPSQLLTLEESAILLKEQTKKWQELQAKLAAQKLSEGLKISMGSFTPDGGPMAAYREVQDEGARLSSDED